MTTATTTRENICHLIDVCISHDLLNGDGHNIFLPNHYINILNEEYHTEISKLCKTHVEAFYNDGTTAPQGIWSLDFHFWIATKILQTDSQFKYAPKIGKGSQAQTILKAAKQWASAK